MTARRLATTFFVAALTVTAACQTHAGPTPAGPIGNEDLLAAARTAQPDVIRSLDEMVGIESGSHDTDGLAKMADYAARRLRGLGAATELLPAAGDAPTKLVKGVFTGGGALHVLLIAHLDTVYQQGVLQSQPYHRDGNRLYGPGIADDKGGIAVILHSLDLLRRQGWRDYARLTVLFNPDEEIGSPGSGRTITDVGGENDVVLSFEPSPAKAVTKTEGVLLKAAGVAEITLTVHGRAAHAGAAPQDGRNAVTELAYQLLQTRDIAEGIPGAQLNWTSTKAGGARNQIPDLAEAGADVRITAPGAGEKLLAAVQAKVNEGHLVPDTRNEAALTILRPLFDAGERGLALAEMARSIYADLPVGDAAEGTPEPPAGSDRGRPLTLIPGTAGGTDAGYAADSGKPAVLEGLGLAGANFHAENEYVEVDSIVPRLYLTTRMLVELGKKADSGERF